MDLDCFETYTSLQLPLSIDAVIYMIALFIMTVAVILVADIENPQVYNFGAKDVVRAICEILVLLLTIYHFIHEILEMVRLRKDYLRDPFNIVDVGATALIFLIVPLRFIGVKAQWGVYSFAYLLSVMRTLKYAPIIRSLKTYTRIMYELTTTTFMEFLAMFTLVALAFTGTLSLALRLDDAKGYLISYRDDGTQVDGKSLQTSNFWHILLSSIRVLIQVESVFDYYDDEHEQREYVFGWYGTLIVMVYLFVVLVMLLNILIAQLSDVYNTLHRDAQLEVDANRAWIVARVELDAFNSLFFHKESYRLKYYINHTRVSAERLLKYQSTRQGCCKEHEKHIINVTEQLNDLEKTTKVVEERLNHQQDCIDEILNLLNQMKEQTTPSEGT